MPNLTHIEVPPSAYSDTTLGDYEYVQDCEKFDLDVALVLYPRDAIPHRLARTVSHLDSYVSS